MPTPVSGSTPYCTGAQFILRYDVRTVAECLSDTDTPITEGSVPTNDTLVELLMAASGKLEAACNMGGKYSPTDLAALTGNSAKWLASIVADLAAPAVLGRRFIEFPEWIERNKEAEGVLKALSEGTMIFGLQESINASRLDSYVETNSDVEAREMITTQAQNYFGRRANRNTTRM